MEDSSTKKSSNILLTNPASPQTPTKRKEVVSIAHVTNKINTRPINRVYSDDEDLGATRHTSNTGPNAGAALRITRRDNQSADGYDEDLASYSMTISEEELLEEETIEEEVEDASVSYAEETYISNTPSSPSWIEETYHTEGAPLTPGRWSPKKKKRSVSTESTGEEDEESFSIYEEISIPDGAEYGNARKTDNHVSAPRSPLQSPFNKNKKQQFPPRPPSPVHQHESREGPTAVSMKRAPSRAPKIFRQPQKPKQGKESNGNRNMVSSLSAAPTSAPPDTRHTPSKVKVPSIFHQKRDNTSASFDSETQSAARDAPQNGPRTMVSSTTVTASSTGLRKPAPAPKIFQQKQKKASATPPDDSYNDPHTRNPRPHPNQKNWQGTSQEKAPRAGATPTGKAYRGWAPPSKEHSSQTTSQGQKKRVMVEDQYDEDGNLVRITTTKAFAPDWQTTTKKEIIQAAQAPQTASTQPLSAAWNSIIATKRGDSAYALPRSQDSSGGNVEAGTVPSGVAGDGLGGDESTHHEESTHHSVVPELPVVFNNQNSNARVVYSSGCNFGTQMIPSSSAHSHVSSASSSGSSTSKTISKASGHSAASWSSRNQGKTGFKPNFHLSKDTMAQYAKNLGGVETVATTTKIFYDKVLSDPDLKVFFKKHKIKWENVRNEFIVLANLETPVGMNDHLRGVLERHCKLLEDPQGFDFCRLIEKWESAVDSSWMENAMDDTRQLIVGPSRAIFNLKAMERFHYHASRASSSNIAVAAGSPRGKKKRWTHSR